MAVWRGWRRRWCYLASFLLLLPVLAWSCTEPCHDLPQDDQQALHDLPHLRALFDRYAEGDVITPEGLLNLLQGLGLFKDNLTRLHDHTSGDHSSHDHATTNHSSHESGHKSSDDHHDDHGGHQHEGHGGHDDHVTHDHNPDDGQRKRGKDQQIDRDNHDHHHGDDPNTTRPPRGNHSGHDHSHDHHDHPDDHTHDTPNASPPGRRDSARRRRQINGTTDEAVLRGTTHGPRGSVNNNNNSSSGYPTTTTPQAPTNTTTSPATTTTATTTQEPKCGDVSWLLLGSGLSWGDVVTPRGFLSLCPGLVNALTTCPSIMDHSHHDHSSHSHDLAGDEFSADNWIGAVVSMLVIGVVGLACIMAIPALKRSTYYDQVNHFLLALAVGTLAGDALIHLLPHAITMEVPAGTNKHLVHAFYGFTALAGIIMFLFLERCHNLFCGQGHGHSHGGHGHGLGLDLGKSGEDIDKETVGTTTTLEDSTSQITDKIGEKLSKHSKHNSFIYAESTMTLDGGNCFEGCSSNVSPSSDANGNTGPERSRFPDVSDTSSPLPDKHGLVSASDSEVASIDKHIAMCVEKKLACSASEKESLVTTPADKTDMGKELSLILDTPSSGRPKVLRQNSSSFNMVLQEYHVGHHGHSHHGHSHVTGRKDSLRAMILVGDAMHTFLDGMAIGAAYGTSVTGGVATSIAVLCHELPHKVGDFALLFEMGMQVRQAVKMMALLWLLSVAGLLFGVLLGSIQTAAPWIYSFTAGVFIYLALVDLLSELSVRRGEKFGVGGQLLLQGLGMLTGAVIMLFIAIYEHDLEELLRGSF